MDVDALKNQVWPTGRSPPPGATWSPARAAESVTSEVIISIYLLPIFTPSRTRNSIISELLRSLFRYSYSLHSPKTLNPLVNRYAEKAKVNCRIPGSDIIQDVAVSFILYLLFLLLQALILLGELLILLS
ncbi:hypothetical protein ACOSP7_029200 [Xanthoceras sorbifolium]